jgi:hypothetical protein
MNPAPTSASGPPTRPSSSSQPRPSAQRPRYRFLTKTFVETLGLTPIPIRKPRNTLVVDWPTGSMLPAAGENSVAAAVLFEDHFYEREPEGLSYKLCGGQLARLLAGGTTPRFEVIRL